MAAGSTPSRRRARPSSCSTTTPTTGRLTPAADDLHPAARVRRQQLLLRRSWSSADGQLRLCRQPAARQHRHLLHRRGRRTDVCRRGVDPRQLSAKLRLRPDRPVPLLLQPARRQRHRLPGGSQDRRPHLHRPLRARRQPVEHRLPRPEKEWLTSGLARIDLHRRARRSRQLACRINVRDGNRTMDKQAPLSPTVVLDAPVT